MKALLLVTALAWSISVQGDDQTTRFEHARQLYFQGSDGDKRAFDKANEEFEALHREDGSNPRVAVYCGSLRLLEASRTWALWKKNALSREGLELMDRAVDAAPTDLEIRFVRAATTYNLPSFFHRREQSEKDFAYLAARADTAAKQGALEPRLAAASLYFHGSFLRDAHEIEAAKNCWKKAVTIAPQSRAARESLDALKETGE